MTEPGQGDADEHRIFGFGAPGHEADDDLEDLTLPEDGSLEFTSIERLAASLDRIDTTAAASSWLAVSGIEPTEDPELAMLLGAASALHGSLEATTEERAFRSFHQRSRAAIVHLLEQDLTPAPRGGRVGATIGRLRRHPAFAPLVAGVAAASIGAVAIFGGLIPGLQHAPETTSVSNLTPRSTNQELVRISLALGTIREHAERGESVPAPLLREVTEGAARVASMIERSEGVDVSAVQNYSKALENTQIVLESAQTEPDDAGALASAHLAIREGAEVAASYLAGTQVLGAASPDPDTPTATTEPTATATPTGEPTAEPTATGTPVHEPEPTAEPTPSGTPVQEPEPTATPDVTPTATPSPTRTAGE